MANGIHLITRNNVTNLWLNNNNSVAKCNLGSAGRGAAGSSMSLGPTHGRSFNCYAIIIDHCSIRVYKFKVKLPAALVLPALLVVHGHHHHPHQLGLPLSLPVQLSTSLIAFANIEMAKFSPVLLRYSLLLLFNCCRPALQPIRHMGIGIRAEDVQYLLN